MNVSEWQPLGGVFTSPPHIVTWGKSIGRLLCLPWAQIRLCGTGTLTALPRGVRGSPLGALSCRTLTSPPHAVTWQRETLLVFALGTDDALWCWTNSGWKSLGVTFSSPPFAVTTPQHVHIFATGTHSELQHRRWNGSHWDDW